ncbi:MAG TPA: lipoprotein [Aquabacterium sp.]|nr:lipoprotein [Aquabacterium sp.]
MKPQPKIVFKRLIGCCALLASGLLAVGLSGCGQTGPLYLPSAASPAAAASAPSPAR